jgi:putative ABC transport system ATP-binding protein
VKAQTTTETVLAARNLYRFYYSDDDETLALRGVSLWVGAGEMVAIVGPSGRI